MKREELVEKLRELYEENEEAFNDDIEEFDNYCGLISSDDRYEDMEFIGDCFSTQDALERAYYGYDEDGGQFCPLRKYVCADCCGRFISSDHKDYSAYLDDNVINKIVNYLEKNSDHLDYFHISDEANEIINEYFNDKED